MRSEGLSKKKSNIQLFLKPSELPWDLTATQQGGEESTEMSFPVYLTE